MKTKGILIFAVIVAVLALVYKHLKNKKKSLDDISREISDKNIDSLKMHNTLSDKGSSLSYQELFDMQKKAESNVSEIKKLLAERDRIKGDSYAGDQYEGNELSDMLK